MKWQNHIGLDIGTSSVKLVQLAEVAGSRFRVAALGEAQLPPFESQGQWDLARTKAIKDLVKVAKATGSQVALSLPESQVYTRVVEMPFIAEPELTQAIRWQAEQYIPVPLSDVTLRHQVVSLPEQGVSGSKMRVLLIAAPNQVVTNYLGLITAAGLETVLVETEILAVARSLLAAEQDAPTTILLHLGSEATTVAVLAEGTLILTQAVATGGLAITRAVASSLSLELPQAEEYKKTYGLDEKKLDGKVAAAVKPMVEVIIDEVKRVILAAQSHGTNTVVKRVILSGGTALVPGMVLHLTESLGLEVQLGNPFAGIELTTEQTTSLAGRQVIFSVAAGLALKMS